MLYRLLKLINTSNLTRTRYLYQKSNPFIVCAGSQRFCSSKPFCPDDKKVKGPNICVSSRKPLTPCKPRTVPCAPKPDLCKKPEQKIPKPCPDRERKRNKIALLGLLLAATALGYFIYTKFKKEPEEEKRIIVKNFKRPKAVCKVPKDGTRFPKHVPYLLVGGGTASFAAFRAIKSTDPKAKVLVISNECNNPYMRPPLSKEMWFTESKYSVSKLIFKQWNGTERSLFYEPEDFYTSIEELEKKENGGVSVALGWNVAKIDVFNKIAYLEDGTKIAYGKCLLATGASPKNVDVFAQAKPEVQAKITLFREIFDFQELNEICDHAKAIAVIGGGFLGSELACALGRKASGKEGVEIYQIFKEQGNMGKILPEYLSNWTTMKVQNEGVEVIPNAEVEDVSLGERNTLTLHLNNGKKVSVDHAIVALGVEPNTKLADTSELEVDPELGGFLVNAEMEARKDLFIAGDCSCFYDVKLGRRRVEHHDHAVVSGRLAGENMTGAHKPYLHQSMFWSDLGPEVGYEAIGIIDASLPTVGVFAKANQEKESGENVVEETKAEGECKAAGGKPKHNWKGEDYDKGIIFYLRNDTVVGIVLWNVFNRMSIARQVLKDQRKYEDLNEVAKLFNIHEKAPEEEEEN